MAEVEERRADARAEARSPTAGDGPDGRQDDAGHPARSAAAHRRDRPDPGAVPDLDDLEGHGDVQPGVPRRHRGDVLLDVPRFEQPDDITCGPTCLKTVYRYYGLDPRLEEIIAELPAVEGGGTVGVFLGLHALERGFEATIYPFSLATFDPTWYELDTPELLAKLALREQAIGDPKLRQVTAAYREFLRRGGRIEFHDLTEWLIHTLVAEGTPVLTGLCATYLYRTARLGAVDYDDVGGSPEGHFLVICGSLPDRREFVVRDPSRHIPFSRDGRYTIAGERLIQAILTGDSTYDAVFLTIHPADDGEAETDADPGDPDRVEDG